MMATSQKTLNGQGFLWTHSSV